ncbi:MAG: hypothetical protein E7676_00835 [Ruminococcaceae bacterium]|nr:hypothetical protein [Oscillospiraceae bacterium]
MKEKNKKISTLQLTEMAILLALVVALQSISSVGVVTLCLCLVPITLGAIVLDWKCGGILGFAFGLVALFWGIVGKDVFTLYLFQASPVMTILICIVKGTLAGMVPAFVFNALKGKNHLLASIAASVVAPVVNTGVFALGCLIIKNDVIATAGKLGIEAVNFATLLFGVIITANFFIELLINVVFAPSLDKVADVVKKRIKSRA